MMPSFDRIDEPNLMKNDKYEVKFKSRSLAALGILPFEAQNARRGVGLEVCRKGSEVFSLGGGANTIRGGKSVLLFVGTAESNTRHEAKTSAPACVGPGIWAGSWQD